MGWGWQWWIRKGLDPIREAEFWSFVRRAWHETAHLGQLDAILHWLGRRYRYQARVLGKAYIVLRVGRYIRRTHSYHKLLFN